MSWFVVNLFLPRTRQLTIGVSRGQEVRPIQTGSKKMKVFVHRVKETFYDIANLLSTICRKI